MPSRRRPTDYAGATAQLDLAAARKLGPRWVLQPKADGMYARICLNSQGRVAHVFSRQGWEVPASMLAGIKGALLGRPHAELVGELEAGDASLAAVADRGQRLVHLFDMLHDGVRSLTREPYHVRRDALWRQQSEVECYGPDAPWYRDARGRAHDRKTGDYVTPSLTDWRVAPIVRQAPLADLDRLWGEVVLEGDGEGLVAVNLDAPVVGKRAAAKCKLKPWTSIDCVVHEVGPRHVTCLWNGHPFAALRSGRYVEPGNTVEVRHVGWYAAGVTPKHAWISRVRRDLLL
jgi:ATP-dependent DNA ligase